MKNFLKKIPLRFTGVLDDVSLIVFSVDMDEVRTRVPAGFPILEWQGRALISLVDVQIRGMKTAFMPGITAIHYRHVAFRLCLDDRILGSAWPRGIYFLQSFTTRPLLRAVGNLFTGFRFRQAELRYTAGGMHLRSGEQHFAYTLAGAQPAHEAHPEIRSIVQRLDKAWFEIGGETAFLHVMRKEWPLEEMRCTRFECSFFRSARLEAAFRVTRPIAYTWEPLRFIQTGNPTPAPGPSPATVLPPMHLRNLPGGISLQ